MKHKVQMNVTRTERGIFGFPKKVTRNETVYVDDRTYRSLRRAKKKNALAAELREFEMWEDFGEKD